MKSKSCALLPLLLLASACSNKAPADNAAVVQDSAKAATIPLVISSKGKLHRFDVETAVTPEEQEQGLMFRTDLPNDGGMVFPMKPPRTASFWMKNTVIPLDMLFVAPDGTIAFIGANRKPYSREPASAGVPVAGVVELRGGRAAELGLAEGDKVQWGYCAVPGAATTQPSAAPSFCP
ncbi:DUF192 domain-containing protein [Sphingobium sp. SCG-1]|uniref:DUF192 domain-containing protein n=1 Tax=Sphingobium sp. SCG-1 TaxID=2072936 RepID=UPI001CB92095|nr:DUF192 domain-containing protein [Sphingobium sp. SCG-1]